MIQQPGEYVFEASAKPARRFFLCAGGCVREHRVAREPLCAACRARVLYTYEG